MTGIEPALIPAWQASAPPFMRHRLVWSVRESNPVFQNNLQSCLVTPVQRPLICVENIGFEPITFCMPYKRSSQLS